MTDIHGIFMEESRKHQAREAARAYHSSWNDTVRRKEP